MLSVVRGALQGVWLGARIVVIVGVGLVLCARFAGVFLDALFCIQDFDI